MVNCPGPDIPAFYSGKSVFITGGTGFVGKMLVERLLATCPDIKKIYLLIREKKDLTPEKRLQQLKQCQVFDVLRVRHPAQLEKLEAVAGDVTQKQLGLSHADRLKISEVSVVFHSAATVKLQEELRQSVNQNLRSIITLLQLCDSLPNLDVFVHVSTAYSNAELSRVEEKVYPPPVDLQTLLEMVDDENTTQEQFEKLAASKPNTYTFTKAMAEDVVARHGCQNYPMAIFRPTIVISSLQNPFPGWIENLNGPSGVFAGASTGFLRVLRSRGAAKADMIPVDIVADTLIAAAWETAVDRPSKVRVYHCSSNDNSTKWEDFHKVVNSVAPMYPSSSAIMYPHLIIIENKLVHRILEKVLQSFPIYIMEYVTRIINGTRKRQNLIRLNQSLQAMNKAIEFFAVRQWDFATDNTRRLSARLSQADRAIFNVDPGTINWTELYTSFILGIRKYVMREQDKDLVEVRNRIRVLSFTSTVFKVLFTLSGLRLINQCLSMTNSIKQLYQSMEKFSEAAFSTNLMPISRF